jgi:sialic acid synthase
MAKFKIKKKIIDSNKNNFYLIAEIGHNHMGDLNLAMKMFREAKNAGASAVKLQKRDNKSLYIKSFYNEPYNHKNSYGKTYGMHREALEFNYKQYRTLFDFAKSIKIDFFATPFDLPSLEILEKLDLPLYKIASADILNIPLQIEIAKTKKPIILSTGGATLKDVEMAVENITKYNTNLSILQCTASYPADWKDMNLRVIETYKKKFKNHVIGLSDHEAGIQAASIAFMLGARIFEKHFTLNRAAKGTDHSFSLEAEGLRKINRNLHRIPLLLGSSIKKRLKAEEAPLYKMEKSIVASKIIKKGHKLKFDDLDFKCPGNGLSPNLYKKLIGKIAKKNFSKEEPIHLKNIK